MKDILSELKEIFEVEEIDLTANFENTEGWDSLNSFVLVAFLEDEFNIQMSIEDLIKYETVGNFIDYIQSKR